MERHRDHGAEAMLWTELGMEMAERPLTGDQQRLLEDEEWAELQQHIDAGDISPDRAVANFLAWRRKITDVD